MKRIRRFVYNRGFRPKLGNPLYSPSMDYLVRISDEYFLPGAKIVFRKKETRIVSNKKGTTNA